jgi:hypothetical protein
MSEWEREAIGELVENEGEQAVLVLLRKYRAKGLSLRKIA